MFSRSLQKKKPKNLPKRNIQPKRTRRKRIQCNKKNIQRNKQKQITTETCYCQKVIDNTQGEYNEEALTNEGLFPAFILNTKLSKLEDENHKFSVPLNYMNNLNIEELENKAKQQALDLLGFSLLEFRFYLSRVLCNI